MGHRHRHYLPAAGHDWLDRFWPEALQRFRMVAENTYEPNA